MAASEFREALDRLGLSQYHDGLVQEAFDSWEVLADITEKDLDALGVKLGHRRILQRAISEYRNGRAQSVPAVELPSGPTHRAAKSEGSISLAAPDTASSTTARAHTGGKRKYRRHPKPDENAPDRPPSAYVLFSNQVREHLKGQELSFTEIAKTVGERWQVLVPDDKASYESKSQAMKDRYYAQLAEYKKTQDYANYQQYLVDFKAKHEPNNGKRMKDNNNNPASPERRSSDERLASSPDNRESSANSSERHYSDRRRSALGSPQLFNRPDWRSPAQTSTGSPDMASGMLPPEHTGFSPRHNRPAFASINAPHPHAPVPLHSHMHTSLRTNGHLNSPMHGHPMAVSTSMAFGYPTHMAPTPPDTNSPPTADSSRRPTLASETSLPSLIHSDSLGSSNSAGSPLNTSAPLTSAFSRGLSSRELPPLVQSRQNSLSQTLPPMKTSESPGHYSPPASGLATLLRAGEHLANGGDPRIEGNYHS